MTNDHREHYRVRAELVDQLRRDLLGPWQEDELLTQDPPITAYPVGVLFPQPADSDTKSEEVARQQEQDALDREPELRRRDVEDPVLDPGVSLANTRRPSSMGLTFTVDPALSPTVLVHAQGACYDPVDSSGAPVAARRAEARTTADLREDWRRRPLDARSVTVDVLRPGQADPEMLWEGFELRSLVRRPAIDGTVTVTVTLVNGRRVDERALQDAFSLFQPRLTVCAPSGVAAFVERRAVRGAADEEQEVSRLLHRHAPTFATGHGCAADWDWTPPPVGEPADERAATHEIRTEFLPVSEVLLTDSNPEIDDTALTMRGLATCPHTEVISALDGLLAGYMEWIGRREEESAALLGTPHEHSAREQMKQCRAALERMRRGVRLLADPRRPEILHAFRLANEAMAQQRARSAWIKAGRKGEPDPHAGRWRPFQIAFFLLCLEGIADPGHEDRRVADLLWFPTGGGKTEAYLGLIAFTVFLRRSTRGRDGGGVTVLMRYTLRLLTLQQFERAAVLLCAMERIRQGDPEALGTEEMSLGMWVGQSATPNTLARAEESLGELLAGRTLQENNPVQLHACPWCGTRLDAHQYQVDAHAVRMRVRCPEQTCDFREGLPVHLVDESVYDARPTLVIATVDKFASMPWRERTAALFNRDREDGTPPPELIIQDELHLISGPLGTLTGLYETAVDVLADRPKVIASTATIRRAGDQGKKLFARQVAQFPPAGLDSRDSWFAVQTPADRKASRLYAGLLTPSTSQSTLLIRTYANLLHRAARADTSTEVRDAYWSLVGYFNSLRLLAAAELQVHDDVESYLEHLAERDGVDKRVVRELTELTSRANSSEIPARLKQMEKRLPHPETADVLLATNMISVGVDIDRWGLMAVMGQPQTTAEYIQATSRVGRVRPGLVAVMLNATRSRDRSHYEDFTHFHSALYREVESTSVTPFSTRARERGLHAVVVALARILLPEARDNEAAGNIDRFRARIDTEIRPLLLDRVRRISPEECRHVADDFDEFVAWWEAEATTHGRLYYESPRGRKLPALLSPFDDESIDTSWKTLWSLRDVDAESALFMEASR